MSLTFLEIKQKLANYCVYQDRCHHEVEKKMKEFLLIPEAKEEILLYLIQENFLDEERFTRSYIRGKFYIKHWGRIKIKAHLKQKDIQEKLISSCMDEIDPKDYEQQLLKFLEKLLPEVEDLLDYSKKNKAIRHLISKGYEYDEILNAIADYTEKSTD
ncbi:regulatory protein RecX [Elizabethkingia sp. JS20170427COW]|uniref:regulatory protein RecX n=1 Tax=Elizabethkingia sp. JS20170427COW TaxID=2583851 RepID=UPI0011108480|nr:regulatory protein RecX [Elizabethkingia sp. JS20170427COW]QCX52583.1 RecX family transcriptional regulator [Elizabethkingia sp. JS20170427COW]